MKKARRKGSLPFWLPAPTFYFLAAAFAIGIFFLVWAILAESKEENPWITAGLIASVSMITAVVVREGILRYRRNALVNEQKRLDRSLLSVPFSSNPSSDAQKLSLERNAFLLNEIVQKSDAATILGHLPGSHREVFELCERYVQVVTRELATVGVGSPRLSALTRGRDKAERLHKHHMLKWAEIEVRANTLAASESESASVSVDRARAALRVLKTASVRYPDEPNIVASRIAVEEFLLSTRIKAAFERAERAERRGDLETAFDSLLEAERLALKGDTNEKLAIFSPHIKTEMERIRLLMRS